MTKKPERAKNRFLGLFHLQVFYQMNKFIHQKSLSDLDRKCSSDFGSRNSMKWNEAKTSKHIECVYYLHLRLKLISVMTLLIASNVYTLR